MAEREKTIWVILILLSSNIWAQQGYYKGDGTCVNPYIISDSILSLQLNENTKDKIWFSFVSTKNEIFLDITDFDNKPCHYLVFHKTNGDICADIAQKKLIPERNKVCDKTIAYDAATTLSYENINRGLCKCDYCCSTPSVFYAIPYETYIIIIYNPQTGVRIKIKTEKPSLIYTEIKKEDTKQKKIIDKNTDVNEIKIGETLTLENIYFEGGTPNILPVSYDALEGLLAFLQSNPSVTIEIHGHVNGPNQPPDINYSNNLGYRRARAVYDYLVNRKIDKNRIDYKGFGNTQMVYPNAFSEAQMAKNRRVEIKITSK